MGTYKVSPKSGVIEIPGMNTAEGFNMATDYLPDTDYSYAGYGQQMDVDPNVDTGNGAMGLLGNVGNYLGSDGGSGLLKGLTGVYAMYLGNRAQKDNEKNNSLYRRIMTEENTRKGNFYKNWENVSFGGK